ncbi:hypothetical protein [Phytohabitans houttuyneae]|uniref:Uncharacterized protein n=1 Tax=Phytohabitans houttuyneae TaxID=1076126 RepID=A0A6V8KQV2_9ACTN|nr:hypothetical protein [Phytohabitans houttuyneae]GFJ85770.1 hypothetical protein Phou_099500 [Phytohabitans houttuyneae]
MRSPAATADSRLSLWRHVRDFAVPPSMIKTATARRLAGDWAGACSAAHVDVDVDLRALARSHGAELAAAVRADLRHLAPDLLRWHMPRVAPDGLLRPGLTVSLAAYEAAGMYLVVRTPPGWAAGGQRMSIALWRRDGPRGHHPHPRPDRRYRLDLHRHLWDARRTGELRGRAGRSWTKGYAVARWPAEARILLRSRGQDGGSVVVRLEGRRHLHLDVLPCSLSTVERQAPVLPYASTWALPDLELLRRGLIAVDRLHPLVASALAPGDPPAGGPRAPDPPGAPRLVECRGAVHRIALVGGTLAPLDHDPAEVRREELLAALTGTPVPCLQAIDEAHRHPANLADVRARLDHGDTGGALATVEGLIGAAAVLRDGALRDELETAARRRVAYGLFRAGLGDPPPGIALPGPRPPAGRRAHPRHATYC